ELGNCRETDGFDIRAPDAVACKPQHLPRSVVHELQAPVCVDNDDAFDHAREHRFYPRAVPRLLLQPPADLLDRVVERPRDDTQLVGAIAEARRGEITAPIPVSDGCYLSHAVADSC